MASDSSVIVGEMATLCEDFKAMAETMTGPESRNVTAAQVELGAFTDLMGFGRRLLELHFRARATERPATPVAEDGTPLSECRRRRTTYLSVFGKIQFRRHWFHAPGYAGVSPLDAALSLPKRCYSDLLRDWVEVEATEATYDQSIGMLQRIFGLDLSKRALEILIRDDAADVEAFYTRKPVPAVAEEGPILVIQADGAGIRLVDTEPSERTEHQTSKREAIVTSVYSIARYVRTPRAMTALLMHRGTDEPRPQPVRPAPVGKETRGSLQGKAAALQHLHERVVKRDGAHIRDRIALIDGDDALRARVVERFPDFTVVLDIMHVLGYLWAAARALYADQPAEICRGYVDNQLERLLAGQTQAVIDDLTHFADFLDLTAAQRKPVDDAVRYYTNHAAFMRYDLYLARGWPIATGVIEGACKHLVRGRLDRSGMKWTRAGAQAMLHLRAVRINGDWDDYQRFRRHREHLRLYGTSSPASIPEIHVLAHAA